MRSASHRRGYRYRRSHLHRRIKRDSPCLKRPGLTLHARAPQKADLLCRPSHPGTRVALNRPPRGHPHHSHHAPSSSRPKTPWGTGPASDSKRLRDFRAMQFGCSGLRMFRLQFPFRLHVPSRFCRSASRQRRARGTFPARNPSAKVSRSCLPRWRRRRRRHEFPHRRSTNRPRGVCNDRLAPHSHRARPWHRYRARSHRRSARSLPPRERSSLRARFSPSCQARRSFQIGHRQWAKDSVSRSCEGRL